MIRLSKYCCGGNDFIIIDSRTQALPGDISEFVRSLCDRRSGLGADGMILLETHQSYPFRILLFNADGSQAEVSYNGSRCVGMYARDNGIATSPFSFVSDAGPIEVTISRSIVSLQVPPPEDIRMDLVLEIGDRRISVDFTHAGVPYVVISTDSLDSTDLELLAPQLKTHREFPNGTNVALASYSGDNRVAARFFERGVEEETPSSGTGCVAVALLTALRVGIDNAVTVRTAGGDFEIRFVRTGESFNSISTAGPVLRAYDATIAW